MDKSSVSTRAQQHSRSGFSEGMYSSAAHSIALLQNPWAYVLIFPLGLINATLHQYSPLTSPIHRICHKDRKNFYSLYLLHCCSILPPRTVISLVNGFHIRKFVQVPELSKGWWIFIGVTAFRLMRPYFYPLLYVNVKGLPYCPSILLLEMQLTISKTPCKSSPLGCPSILASHYGNCDPLVSGN